MKVVYLVCNICIFRCFLKECVYIGMFEEKFLLNEF